MDDIKRPTGVETPNREFVIAPRPRFVWVKDRSRSRRLKEWFLDLWFYIRNISFGRGSDIEIDVPDETIEWLEQMGWFRDHNGYKKMTRKGSREFSNFIKSELDDPDDRRRKD
jgi:hypothetical protein